MEFGSCAGRGEGGFVCSYTDREKKRQCEEISFDPKYRNGDVWELALDRTDFASFEYNFMIDGKNCDRS